MHDLCPREGLIAIGLTSGLDSIACSVVQAAPESEMLYWEVMPGPRKKRGVPPHRRYHAHKLMLDIIFYRWPPAVIALGPPSSDEEKLEWVVLMRTAVFELGRSLKVPVVLFDTDDAIATGLGVVDLHTRGSGLKALVQKQLPDFGSNKKRLILATATAIAGARQARDFASREGNAL